jgi:predicted mannosyl-3-phosphoglycerate phosphatase (HAD superfamily)
MTKKNKGIMEQIKTTGVLYSALDLSKLREALDEVFNREQNKRNTIENSRPCVIRGFVSIDKIFFHCGYDDCKGCNAAIEDIKQQLLATLPCS